MGLKFCFPNYLDGQIKTLAFIKRQSVALSSLFLYILRPHTFASTPRHAAQGKRGRRGRTGNCDARESDNHLTLFNCRQRTVAWPHAHRESMRPDKLSSARSSWTKKLALERERVIFVSPSGHLRGSEGADRIPFKIQIICERGVTVAAFVAPSPRTDSLQGVRRKQEGPTAAHSTHTHTPKRSWGAASSRTLTKTVARCTRRWVSLLIARLALRWMHFYTRDRCN